MKGEGSYGPKHSGQGLLASSTPHHKGLSNKAPRSVGRPRLRVQSKSPRPGDSLTPAFSGQAVPISLPPKPSKGAGISPLKTREGKGQSRRASDWPLPGPPDPGGMPKEGGFLSRGELGPRPQAPSSRYWPPPSGLLPSRAGVARPTSELTFQFRAAGRPSLGPEFRPHTASSGSRRKQLERGTGSLADPPRTHPLARLRAGWLQRRSGPRRPGCWRGCPGPRRRAPPRTGGAAASLLPLTHSRPSGLLGPRSPKKQVS